MQKNHWYKGRDFNAAVLKNFIFFILLILYLAILQYLLNETERKLWKIEFKSGHNHGLRYPQFWRITPDLNKDNFQINIQRSKTYKNFL